MAHDRSNYSRYPDLADAAAVEPAQTTASHEVSDGFRYQVDDDVAALLAEPEFAVSDTTCPDDEASVQAAARLRSSIGLDGSPETMIASRSDPEYLCTAFGLRLTPDEMAAFAYVLTAQGDLSELLTKIVDDDAFGGAYFQGPELVIASTSGTLDLGRQPAHGTVRLMLVSYTKRELDAVAHEISRGLAIDGNLGDVVITRVSMNPVTNRVDVALSVESEKARSQLTELYGDRVAIHIEPLQPYELLACDNTECGTRGGVSVNHQFSGGTLACTNGFVVRAKWARTATGVAI